MNTKSLYLSKFFLAVFLAVFLLSGCSDNAIKNQPATYIQEISKSQKEVMGEEISRDFENVVVGQPEIPLEIREEAKKEDVAFETINQNDSSLEKGQTKITQEGKNGIKELKYKITYKNKVEINRELVSENITVKPVSKIVLIGTKEKVVVKQLTSCGSDYYRNVDGNCIHRPSSNPAGASARCKDGSYSYSQNRRGTCSGHGGVAQWL